MCFVAKTKNLINWYQYLLVTSHQQPDCLLNQTHKRGIYTVCDLVHFRSGKFNAFHAATNTKEVALMLVRKYIILKHLAFNKSIFYQLHFLYFSYSFHVSCVLHTSVLKTGEVVIQLFEITHHPMLKKVQKEIKITLLMG